jgi:thioredoxin-like negative regulator of GroEL
MERTEEEFLDRLKRFVRGELTWAQVEGLTPKRAQDIANQACELATAGRVGEARTLLEGLAAMNPRDAGTQAALGTVYEKLRLRTEARQAYDAALAEDAQHPVALASRGELRLKTGDTGGYGDLVAAIAADPEGRTAASKRAQAIAKALALAAAGHARSIPRS